MNLFRAELLHYINDRWARLAAVLCPVVVCVLRLSSANEFMTVEVLFSLMLSVLLLRLSLDSKNGDSLKNVVAIGCSRVMIYFAQLLAAFALTAALWSLTLLPFLLLPDADVRLLPQPELAVMLVNSYLMQMGWAALSLLCCMGIRTKGAGEAVFAAFYVAATLFSHMATQKLVNRNEIVNTVVSTEVSAEEARNAPDVSGIWYEQQTNEQGEKVWVRCEQISQVRPNPSYPNQPVRAVYQAASWAFPQGQTEWYMYLVYHCRYWNPDHPEHAQRPDVNTMLFPLWSLLCIGAYTAAGLLLFRRKDLT